jgi:hypothetical protein
MAPSATSERKITVSFTNWILGGSLLQVKTSENGTHRRSSGRSVVVTEVDSVKPFDDSSKRTKS